ncbi:protein-L-isoaspartate(D-aspartate) O-methyltransferase [bacterium]|nr:protein-L-isoaspartate(D-aspartate) O-methyltransferase [bacterium]MBU1063885.1 protein-L-isoaspartate(D-aspartate) O-methyltransferase [bacterium]MBU1633226.1 protein-L-isoaspartate(D-aspartate) O-methyltransferase [bacterium]MBU1874173.1 protein-L-isoaspartate(D-aspartate) O-methyltransferase [bacterium]
MKNTRNHRIILFPLIAAVSLICTTACGRSSKDDRFERYRSQMVKNQIISRGISDSRVLAAMRTVPRHLFVPENYQRFSYADRPLPIEENQTISQPYIVALMTELAELKTTDKVLEVGTGSGYQAAVLAEICDSVFTVEINATLAQRAKTQLKDLGYQNIFFKTGDGYLGWNEHAPYNAIIVTCAPSDLPDQLASQLIDGGRLVIPHGPATAQNLIIYRKQNGYLIAEKSIPVRFVPMVDDSGKSY